MMEYIKKFQAMQSCKLKLELVGKVEITASDVASLTISLLFCSVVQPAAKNQNENGAYKGNETINCLATTAVVAGFVSFGTKVPVAASTMPFSVRALESTQEDASN